MSINRYAIALFFVVLALTLVPFVTSVVLFLLPVFFPVSVVTLIIVALIVIWKAR